MDYDRYLTETSKSRKVSPIHSLMPLLHTPGLISLGGGLPNPATFPIKQANITLQDGTVLEITPHAMAMALQYSETPGLPKFVSWLTTLQKQVHNPPRGIDFYSICAANGSQDMIGRAFDMLINRGDNVLIENPTYAGALSALKPLGCNLIAIETDGEGLIPASLEKKLKEFESSQNPPRILYTVPNGSNPTGASAPESRKKEIYALAQKYNLLILEDDAYFYLQFHGRTPSYLSMDIDGRVLRFDSFSKIISSGIRLGFVTGPPPLVDRLDMHIQATALHPSGISQILMLELLNHMGHDGFIKHVDQVAAFYHERMKIFLELAKKHLTGLAEWNVPSAGMFFWMKLIGIEDSYTLIKEKALEQKVLLIPGNAFIPDDREKTPYVRAAFSNATPEQIDEALRRVALLLRSTRNIN